jgi:hypothetical protein
MIRYLIAGAKRALGLHRPGRNLAVLPNDVFLVSYPKSGNTWARFLVANITRPDDGVDFSSVNRVIPDPEITTYREFTRVPQPRIIKSHQYFDPRYQRVIYIVRDPRDVVLSQYHFQRKRKLLADDFPLAEFVNRFLAGQTCAYGSWGENVVSWLATRYHQSDFLLLRYEDMTANTDHEVARVVEFLGLDVTPQQIARAVERSSADTMRRLEKSQAQQFSSTKDTRQDIPFVRAAKSGGWRKDLPEQFVGQIEAKWGNVMTFLNYPLVTRAASGVEPELASFMRSGPVR